MDQELFGEKTDQKNLVRLSLLKEIGPASQIIKDYQEYDVKNWASR